MYLLSVNYFVPPDGAVCPLVGSVADGNVSASPLSVLSIAACPDPSGVPSDAN